MISVLPDQFTLVRSDTNFSQVFLQLNERFLPIFRSLNSARVDELGKFDSTYDQRVKRIFTSDSPITWSAMFEESSYIGSRAPSTDGYGFHLPAMPKQPILLAAYQYGPDKLLTLHPDSRNQASHERDDPTLHVKLVRPLKIGYGRKVQTVLAEVTDGRADILGQQVVLRCFDTLYVSPNLLEVIDFCRNRFTMSLLKV